MRQIAGVFTAVLLYVAGSAGVALGDSKTINADLFYSQGIKHLLDNEYDQAIFALNAAVSLRPGFGKAVHALALSHLKRGDYERSIELFDETIRLDPKTIVNFYWRGTAHRSLGAHDKAIADFTKVIQIEPDNTFALMERGTAFLQSGSYDEAISDFDQVIRLKPSDLSATEKRNVASRRKIEHRQWVKIRDSRNAKDFQDFLKRWPGSAFSSAASEKIEELLPHYDQAELTIALLEVAIVQSHSKDQMHRPKLSRKLLQKFDHLVTKYGFQTYQLDVEDVVRRAAESEGDSGVITEIYEGGRFVFSSTGYRRHSVSVVQGDIGLVDGEIYVSDGTRIATPNNLQFVFSAGEWKVSHPSPIEQSVDDKERSVDKKESQPMLVLANLYWEKLRRSGGSADDWHRMILLEYHLKYEYHLERQDRLAEAVRAAKEQLSDAQFTTLKNELEARGINLSGVLR